MQPKRALGVLLLLFAVGSIVALVVEERGERDRKASQGVTAPPQSARSDRPTPDAQRHVIAYYFHGNFRCSTCLAIERLSKETIEKEFGEELHKGLLEFRAVNTDEPDNQHYVKDYQLYAQSLVLVEYVNGKQTRWKNLKRVWELVHDEAKFRDYVRRGVDDFLKGVKS